MLVKILLAFRYSVNAQTQVSLEPGQVADIAEDLIEGLHAEGFIAEASAADLEAAQGGPVVIQPPVEIPADYADLSWLQLRPIAAAVNGGPVKDKKTALAVIAAEVAARAGA